MIGLLRKLHAEEGINWEEALPRALRHIHDRLGEDGLSPYKIFMSRDRPLPVILYSPERNCLEALNYFDHIEKIDKLVAANLNLGHQQTQDRHNSQIKSRTNFQVGDMVWLMNPKPAGGHKLQTYWLGPTTISSRSGKNSFTIITKEGDSKEVPPHNSDPTMTMYWKVALRSIFIAPTIENPRREPHS